MECPACVFGIGRSVARTSIQQPLQRPPRAQAARGGCSSGCPLFECLTPLGLLVQLPKVLEFGGSGSQLLTGQITNGTEGNRQAKQRVPDDGITTGESLEDLGKLPPCCKIQRSANKQKNRYAKGNKEFQSHQASPQTLSVGGFSRGFPGWRRGRSLLVSFCEGTHEETRRTTLKCVSLRRALKICFRKQELVEGPWWSLLVCLPCLPFLLWWGWSWFKWFWISSAVEKPAYEPSSAFQPYGHGEKRILFSCFLRLGLAFAG